MRRLSLVFAVLLSGLAGLHAAAQAKSQPMRTQAAWEYREVRLGRTAPSQPGMNTLGAEGWELVSVVSACEAAAYCQWYAYFKRRM